MTRLDPAFGMVFDAQPIRPRLLERALAYWKGSGSCTHQAVFDRIGAVPAGGGPRYLIRVDDFPRWDREPDGFIKFHALFRDSGIRYLLGVIPRPCRDPHAIDVADGEALSEREAAVLQTIAPEVDIALHGLTHQSLPGPIANEIAGLPPAELERRLELGIETLAGHGLTARSFIPPFNAVDEQALELLAARFDAVFGGPESIRWLGCRPGPSRIGDCWYLPSYPPAYGRAEEVGRFVAATRDSPIPVLLPLTLHWAWEEPNGFRAVARLIELVGDRNVSLPRWLDGAAWTEER